MGGVAIMPELEPPFFMRTIMHAVGRGAAVLTICLFAAGAGAGGAEIDPPKQEQPAKNAEAPPVTWRTAVVPGPAVTLRMKRPVGKSMIYQGSLDREQRSASSYHEIDSFYANSLCQSQQDGQDMIAILRSFLDRKRTEKLENGKT